MPVKNEPFIRKKGAWFEVKKGGSFLTIDAMAELRLKSLSRKRRTRLRSQPLGWTKPW
jgi:hypothetical protein